MSYTKHNIKTSLVTIKGKCYVRVRVSCLGKRADLHTGISMEKEKWISSKGRVKQGAVVNNRTKYNVINTALDDMESFVDKYFNSCALRDTEPNLVELKERFSKKYIKSNKEESEEFFYQFSQYISTTSKTRKWGVSMKKYFSQLVKKLKAYKPDLKFSDLSEQFMNGFVEELSKTMYDCTIKKHLSYLKQFVTWADKRNYGVNKEFFAYSPKLENTKKAVRYLTIDELNSIRNCELAKGGYLDRTRDFFVFQCCTGLRYCDIKKMKPTNIVEREDGSFDISILTEKDNDNITYKMSEVAKEIYLKYRGFQYDGGVLFPVISNQKYNKYLKELGKKVGLKGIWVDYEYKLGEPVEIITPKADLSTHTARRTFVVLAWNAGAPLELIGKITSHSDFDAMRPYLTINKMGTDKVIEAFDKAVGADNGVA